MEFCIFKDANITKTPPRIITALSKERKRAKENQKILIRSFNEVFGQTFYLLFYTAI